VEVRPARPWRALTSLRGIRYPGLLASGFIFLVSLASVIRERPYFGNMDDGQFIELAGSRGPWGFVVWWDHLANGSIRYVSLALLWPIYRIGHELGPTSLFIVNAAVVLLCLLAFWRAFEPTLPRRSSAATVTFIGVAMLWPFSADLIFFPSLQEKFVILGAAAVLAWTRSVPLGPVPLKSWLLFAFVIAFAFPTKLHIVVFVPALVLALWIAARGETPRFTRGGWQIASAVLIWASILIVAIATQGGYTSSRRGSLFDVSRLVEWRFLLLALTAVAFCLLLVIDRRWGRWSTPREAEADLLPLVMLISMLGTFLVWDVVQRYLTVASVMVGAAAAVQVVRLRPRVGACVAMASLALAGIWLTVRLPQVFGSHGSFGEFIRSETASLLSGDKATVYSTCFEAPERYAYYAAIEGAEGIRFAWWDEGSPILGDRDSRLVLADGILCPLSDSRRAEAVLRWRSETGRGFQLLEVVP